MTDFVGKKCDLCGASVSGDCQLPSLGQSPVLTKLSAFLRDVRGVRANMSSLLAPLVSLADTEDSTLIPLISSVRCRHWMFSYPHKLFLGHLYLKHTTVMWQLLFPVSRSVRHSTPSTQKSEQARKAAPAALRRWKMPLI